MTNNIKKQEKIENKYEKTTSSKDELKKEKTKHVFLTIVFIVVILGSLFLSYFLTDKYMNDRNSNSFEYHGLKYEKTKLGDITFYETHIPVQEDGLITGSYKMGIRNDPRELEYINVTIKEPEELDFYGLRTIYIVVDKDLKNCDLTIVSIATLTNFLETFGNFELDSGTNSREIANELNLSYVSPATYPKNTIITLKSGNETKIEKTRYNHYELDFNECEVNQVMDKFIVEIINQYMDEFEEEIRG